jgi:aminopeptidase N
MRASLCSFNRRRAATAGALALVVAGLIAAPAASAWREPPTPGAPGIGDRLFPTLGNGGYDARHYDLKFTYPTSAPSQTVNGRVTMIARATQSLSRFNLDFAGEAVESVRVNGSRADWTRSGDELVITPRHPIRNHRGFVTRVDFTSGPYTPGPEQEGLPFGWFATVDGSVMAGQPDKSQTIYPVNDHPADKATYTIRVDVPEGVTAVANGVRVFSSTRGGRTVSVYVMRQPMASELIQVAVGDLAVIDRGRSRGVPLRDVAANACRAVAEPLLARTPFHIDWMVDRAGRYPFDLYGVLAANQEFGYALETQTLSLHPCFLFDPAQFPNQQSAEAVLVHELAHQWYGDSVAPESWSDVWLNEGHATWYEWTYGDEFFGGPFELVERIHQAYTQGNIWRAQYGPVALPTSNELFDLFSPNVYDGAATVLYALRQVIGDRTFRELERQWAQRYEGESVGTEDFIALASRVSGRNLGPFLRDWLYGTEIPPMPGHPDWQPDPVASTARRSQSAAQALERQALLEKH